MLYSGKYYTTVRFRHNTPYVNDSLKSQTIWPRITELTACSARNIIKSTHIEWTLNLTQSVAYSLYIESIQHNNIEPISLPVNLKSINQYTPSRTDRCCGLHVETNMKPAGHKTNTTRSDQKNHTVSYSPHTSLYLKNIILSPKLPVIAYLWKKCYKHRGIQWCGNPTIPTDFIQHHLASSHLLAPQNLLALLSQFRLKNTRDSRDSRDSRNLA